MTPTTRSLAVAAALLVSVAACTAGGGSPATPAPSAPASAPASASAPATATVRPAASCASLQGQQVPASAIGLPTNGAKVLAATPSTDTDKSGQARSYCKVTGEIASVDATAQPIRFEVNLPDEWNQRALQMGGGGTDGTVVTGLDLFSGQPASIPTALARGFVTLGSDSGHNADKSPPFDTHFATNQEQLLNFGQQQVKKTLDAAKAVMRAAYGQDPRYAYFIGGSQGGHEGFDAAQRYPDDYNGVIAQYPAYDPMNMWFGAWNQAKAVYGTKSGVPSPSWMNPAKVANLVKAVVIGCDGLDGVTDGLISDVKACNNTFTIDTVKTTLRCPNGADTGDSCLSDPQIAAVEKINSPVDFGFAFASGSTSYPKWPILEGSTFLTNHLGKTDTAQNPPVAPFDPVKGSAFQLLPANGAIKGFVTGNFDLDPLAFDPGPYAQKIKDVSGQIEATSTDLHRFTDHGGKIIIVHGTIDDSITPYNTVNYWNRLLADNGGPDGVRDFARFYLVPGMGHGEGLFFTNHDWLSTLQNWVEQGTAPTSLVASDGNSKPPTAATNGRTRPLCEYGTYPRYTGPANPTQAQANDAANFTCTVE
jgi:pimeloyl-ACP methyl ester carboxylesterase